MYEEVGEVATVPKRKEERSKKIEEKLNILSAKCEIREMNAQKQLKKIDEQLSKIQTMLEMMETNNLAAGHQCNDYDTHK
jgi:chaperonin cofactor prefoldin